MNDQDSTTPILNDTQTIKLDGIRKKDSFFVLIMAIVLLFTVASTCLIIYKNGTDGSSLINKRSLNLKSILKVITNSKPKCPHGYVGKDCNIECGLSFTKTNLKIVGGLTANPNSWPAHALISGCDSNDCSICGGTLIDEQTVLTAAHCVSKNDDVSYDVYLGLHDTMTLSKADISPAVKMSVKKIIKHENFDENILFNDIALFILSSKAPLNNFIQIACLPSSISNTYPTQNESWSVGWGHTSYEGSSPTKLNNVKLTIYSNTSFCGKVSPFAAKNWNKQICAGEIGGGKDTCQGDSGGPLYVLDKVSNKTKHVLGGIVSYGDECATVGKPGIYTRVSNYLPWIIDNSPTMPNFVLNSSQSFYSSNNFGKILIIFVSFLIIHTF